MSNRDLGGVAGGGRKVLGADEVGGRIWDARTRSEKRFSLARPRRDSGKMKKLARVSALRNQKESKNVKVQMFTKGGEGGGRSVEERHAAKYHVALLNLKGDLGKCFL